jgi:midasin
MSRRLNELSLPWQLKTGLSMERLWSAFRPLTPSTWQKLDTMLRLENLAVRFDSVSRKIRQPINDIVALSQSISATTRNLLMEVDDWNTPLKVCHRLHPSDHII